MKRKTPKAKPFKLALMAEEALKLAVYEAIRDHARTGDPVAIWKNGHAVTVNAKRLKIKKPKLKYFRGMKISRKRTGE